MQTQTAPTSWHVLLVKPRTEKKVAHLLSENGFETCVPVQKQLRQWSDRRKLVEVVLFNRYVFVSLDSRQLREIIRFSGSCRLVRFGERIATLTRAEVSMIRQLSLLPQPVAIEYREFQPGETVEICSGPLAGQQGQVIALNGVSRMLLALPTLGCFANVELRGEQVRRLHEMTLQR